jgi:DNA-directed RNA polymerase subunit RPC12/RpoP
MAYDIGEKPGKGTYKCSKCGWKVRLDDDSDRLPPCGTCGKNQVIKYDKVG